MISSLDIEQKTEEQIQYMNELIRYAKSSVSSKPLTKHQRKIKATQQKLRNMLQSPYDNYKDLQIISKQMFCKNGIYQRIILYWSSLLTYDYLLYPTNVTEDNKEKILDKYKKAALSMDKLNPKFNCPWITLKYLIYGEVYLYKIEDNNGVVFKEIPREYCRISENQNGVLRYEIDISKINKQEIEYYPQEFQNIFNEHNDKNNNKKDNWYSISNKGVVFASSYDNPHGYPTVINLLPDILEIDNIQDFKSNLDKTENTKLIHCLVPIDDKGIPIMDKKLVDAYKQALQDELPEGFSIIVNPFETDSISLNGGTQSQQRNFLEEAIDNIYKNAGISDLLFANKKASSEALKQSIKVDTAILFNYILPMYSNYFNSELSKFKIQIKMIECTYLDREDKMKIARESMASGGSRLYFNALNGFSPLETINILSFEQNILNIDELFVPKKDSHTMGKENSENGRPTKEEVGESIGDAGEKTIEQQ